MALGLREHGASVQVRDGAAGQSAYGKVITTSLGEDRFTVEFTPDAPGLGPAPVLYGVPIAAGVVRSLTARRLAGQRLEVCEGERCVTLERFLDAYDHDVR